MENKLSQDSELPKVIYIKEQGLKLYLDEPWAYFDEKENIHVLIGREFNPRQGINMGDLMAGIIELIPQVEQGRTEYQMRLVLPFTKRLLYAKFKEPNGVELAYVDGSLRFKEIELDESGNLNFADYAFLLNEEDRIRLKPQKRELVRAI